jgi:FHS family L-fucose permease-like MFS transporter
MQELRLNEEQSSSYYLAALILFTVSRFACTGLMKFFSPGTLLSSLALMAIGCTLMVIYAGGMVGCVALVCISGCMSLMFPTIYGLSVRGLGEDTKIGGSGLIMAILGGAVLTAIQGQVSDATSSINMSYWVPLGCFLVIAYYGLVGYRLDLRRANKSTR